MSTSDLSSRPTFDPRDARLKGDDHVDDSLTQAMLAAARLVHGGAGEPTDYATAFCRSTNAFGPMICTGEDCTAHWHCQAWLADVAIDHLAASLGVRVRKLDLPDGYDDDWPDDRKVAFRRRMAGAIRPAMDRGAVVLTTGGWDIGLKEIDGQWKPVGPHGFVFWGAAGIITEADPHTGAILGAHPNGHVDNPILRPADMWVVTADPAGAAEAMAIDRRTLQLAVARLRSGGRFARDGTVRFGTDAVGAWADHMAATPGFCAPCYRPGTNASLGDAMANGKRLYRSAGIAADYLRTLADRFPAAAGDALRAAAAHYDRARGMIAPAVTDGPDHYRHWLGDGARQREHAAVLRRIDAELLAAADDMHAALAVLNVKRDDDHVWIEGVEGFSTDRYASSVHGSQARILETLGETLAYDDLVCYAGFAFRVGWHDAGCPSAGHPCCGYMCVSNGIRALPWTCKVYEAFPWDAKTSPEQRAAFEAEVNAAIRFSIDRGIPVHYGSEEDGLIIGYADGGRRWYCVHPYYNNSKPFWHDEVTGGGAAGFAGGKWPWAVVVWQAPKAIDRRADPRDLLIAALEQAVDMWRSDEPIEQHYFTGDAAYDSWIGWLRDVEAGTIEDPAAAMQGNGWCFDVLVQNRRIAGAWLKKQAALFDGDAAEHLTAAAEHYAEIPLICLKGLDCTWALAPGPQGAASWTGDMRREQIARLEAARAHDAAAIEHIARMLELVQQDD